MGTLNWQYFPKSDIIPKDLLDIVNVFNKNHHRFDSDLFTFKSNDVLALVTEDLESLGFEVEKGKSKGKTIEVPVLFGPNGKLEKSFKADAYKSDSGIVLEVEAGRAFMNNQFLKDLFQACMMQNVDYLVIAVRNIYLERYKDFESIITFFDTLYASRRLTLPLKGILIIGY
ncbi:hypothetical protein [Fredinandcohnia onubensis]|uniref:hypothetical protein n=1 Tax=Fredinandcohnia onubensis TaxID=1571209 RepID=UPI000C0C059C|nr:hypothetical protein [Fredinandcohnia onubensis]